jgi:hypothetical protein
MNNNVRTMHSFARFAFASDKDILDLKEGVKNIGKMQQLLLEENDNIKDELRRMNFQLTAYGVGVVLALPSLPVLQILWRCWNTGTKLVLNALRYY